MLHFAKQHSPDSLRTFLYMRKTQITDNWPILGFLQALYSSYIANPFLFPYTIPSGGGMMRRRFWGRGKASICSCSHVLVPGCHLPHHLSRLEHHWPLHPGHQVWEECLAGSDQDSFSHLTSPGCLIATTKRKQGVFWSNSEILGFEVPLWGVLGL